MRRIIVFQICLLVLFVGCDSEDSAPQCSQQCTGNTVCENGICVPHNPSDKEEPGGEESHGTPCGTSVCSETALCLNGQCIDRDNKAVSEQACNKQTFGESCDGNKLVYCRCDENGKCQTAVAECSGNETCVLMADRNLGMCAIADAKCAQSGEFTRCFDLDAGMSYLEYYTCAQAVDGKYYPFREEEIRTADCVGVCVDAYRCNLKDNDEKCGSDFVESCDGNIMVYCAEGLVYRMNCEDYDTTCVMNDGKSDCDWK